MTAPENPYLVGWRQRGEAEQALRQWRQNQSSPTFSKIVGTLGGLVGAAMFAAFIHDPDWGFAPMLLLAAMFFAMPFIAPSVLREEERKREEAKATLKRLGITEELTKL